MNQLETKYLIARAQMMDNLYSQINSIRQDLGLDSISLATEKDYSRTITPQTGMTTYNPERGVYPYGMKPVVIEGIPMVNDWD